MHRKHAPRRKAGSLALSAALLASPLVPLASAQTGGSSGTTTEENDPGEAGRVLAGDAILRYGDTGAAVAAVQQKLTVDDDGIFGPITEGAVKGFQGRIGIPATGEVDSRTWTELFRTVVSFVPEGSPEAKAIQASVSGDAAVAKPKPAPKPEPEPEPRVATPKAAADEHEHETKKPASKPEKAASKPEKAASGDDDAKAEKTEEPKAQKGGARPKAGIDKASKVPEPKIEVSDKVAVTGDGSCATGKMGTPVKGTVTGTFGEDRGSHRHGGLDIAAPSGTGVLAALCGTVTQAGAQGAYGNLICIRHTAEFSTCYAHLSSFNARAGQYVAIGQLIGRVGSTGRSTGPHLHFETRINGRAHDPEPYLRGERTVPGTGEKPSRAQRASASPSSSGSGETRTASTRDSQQSGTGGGTPPNGVAYEESTQESASASQSESQQAPAQEPAAQEPAGQEPAAQEPAAQEPAPAEEQASAQQQPAPEQQSPAPAQQEAAEEPAPAEVAVTQAVEVAPQAAVTTEAPVEEAPAAPVEEAVAPVVEEVPAASVEEAVAPVVEETPVAEVVEEAPAAVVPTPAG
ncbi:MAG TPA: peptidoglycan DD-metalloendopeptidase family protein [Solirubrobacteraceae bacterium]|nr:peptidoglycan DD-metalloendopeptidase family protein [Solirubrobacteraceae bacterium]